MRDAKFTIICLTSALLTGCASNQGGSNWFTPKSSGVDSYVQGANAMDAGDKQRAVAALQRSIQQNPELITPRIMLGGVYRSDGDYQSALTQYQTLVKLDPYTASNHYYLGLCYQLLDRLQDAANSYQQALKLKPNDADANMNLGLVYLATGRLDDATQHTLAATKINPKSAPAWANYAVTLDAIGDYTNAESAYRRSLELDSSQPTTLLNLATNLVLQNRGGDAIPLFEQGLKQEDSALGRKRYGDALSQVKRYDDAIRQYDAALKLNPRYFPVFNEMGKAFIALYRAGYELDDSQRQSAVAAWRKGLEINPNQPDTQALIDQWSKQPLSH
ncbi:MAG TPA: tetratricopeptide repeat protein [Tepidisphaeraceae bacterium]|jgi:tetratricopeptide (TPR) repeat protein|nr:tetratricopeptide repeat protein [Tepidisphaeraceae bacterium]